MTTIGVKIEAELQSDEEEVKVVIVSTSFKEHRIALRNARYFENDLKEAAERQVYEAGISDQVKLIFYNFL